MHKGNVIIVSPRLGPIASRFAEYGASVRIGEIENILEDVRDVFVIICNTIMTGE